MASSPSCPNCRLFRPATHSCRRRDPGETLVFSRKYKRRSLAAFLETRRLRCEGCDLVLETIEAWSPGWIASQESDAIVRLVLNESSLSICLSLDGKEKSLEVFQSHDDPENTVTPLSTKPFFSAREIVADTTQETAFQRMRSWLANCVTNHDCCSEKANRGGPRRLLKVQEASGDEDRIFLVEDLPRSVRYATLSYCWGTDLTDVIRTLKANKAAHMKEIPTASLPKTVQDAVTVCRRLGIGYLWFDALCIIQDDTYDWETEVQQMKNIFEQSHLTIAAHAAASCKDGFLGPQTYGQKDWQRAFWTSYGPHERNKAFLRIGTTYIGDDAEADPLSTRAWALQEVVLSPRTLHFLGREMAWACKEQNFCECDHLNEISSESLCSTERAILPIGRQELTNEAWMDLINIYTSRKLTYGSDKLAAISGLAELVARALYPERVPFSMGEIYVAGIFLSDFPAHLLWSIEYPDDLPLTDDPRPYRAPSWSWTAVDVSVQYPTAYKSGLPGPTSSLEPLATFLSAGTFPLQTAGTANEKVLAGDLILEGRVVPVELVTVESPDDREYDLDACGFELIYNRRVNLIRLKSGRMYEVTCDKTRNCTRTVDDSAHRCFFHPKLWLDSEEIQLNQSMDEDVEESVHDSEDAEDNEDFEDIEDSDVSSSDGSIDYGSEGQPEEIPIFRREMNEDEKTDDESDQGSWKTTDSVKTTRLLHKFCKRCRPEHMNWSEPQFCALELANLSARPDEGHFLVLQRSETVPGAWERIGIGYTDETASVPDGTSTRCSIFPKSELRTMRLV